MLFGSKGKKSSSEISKDLCDLSPPPHQYHPSPLPFSFPEPPQSFFLPQDLCTHFDLLQCSCPALSFLHPTISLYPSRLHWVSLPERTLPCSYRLGSVPLTGPVFLLAHTQSEMIVQCLTFPPNHGLLRVGPVLLTTASQAYSCLAYGSLSSNVSKLKLEKLVL